ncbi:MAG TPA: hypothetical protein DEB23_02530 [Chitinophagaceae bacterium]|nr:hypothetical protein [Chitinophagaceae bacterium]
MKTAMQIAIESYKNDGVSFTDWFINNYEILLEKEKEQICNSYVEGLEGLYMGAEEYYNQTYNQEETLEEWKSKFTHHCAIKTNKNK